MDLVTGATGFVGAHVARALLDAGERVRCLVRAGSDRRNLEGLDVELVEGDLLDAASLRPGLDGIRRLFHVAADYRLFVRDPASIYRANVDGTRALYQAAAEAGVERVVHTSSVGALGLRDEGRPADEETPVVFEKVVGHYKRSKVLAEREAEAFAARGLDVVIVNPSTPVGEGDVKPTPTGKIIVDFLNRKMPAYVDTGLNLIDVHDVAIGHLLAAEKGQRGRKYILGNEDLTLKQILDLLASITGLSAPTRRVPHWIPLLVGAVDTTGARLFGYEPRVALEAVRMSRHRMFFSSARAVRELGLPQSPVRGALERAVAWFRENGYVQA